MNLPDRYALPNSFAVNRVITTLNMKLKKSVKALPHTYFTETDNTRMLFTNHGLHMNKLGKQLVNCKIVAFIYSILEQKKSPPISLGWHEPQNCNYLIQEDNQIISVTRNSSCNKKLPITRSTLKNYRSVTSEIRTNLQHPTSPSRPQIASLYCLT